MADRDVMRRTARDRGTRRRARPFGFTLVELITTISMIGILAGMTLSRVNISRYRADAAARMVRSVLQQAQRSAVVRQTNIIVSFDLANKRVVYIEDANSSETVDAGERTVSKYLSDGVTFTTPSGGIFGGTPSSGVTGTSLKTINGLPSVVFRRDGAASSDVQIYLLASRNRESETVSITVDQPTGHTDFYKKNGSTWMRRTM